MKKYRPVDLAREHGISPQAVRNYEGLGLLPPAQRSPTGFRLFTEVHAAALRALLALMPAHGHATAREVMHELNAGRVDAALAAIDRSHARLLRDREALTAVGKAVMHLTAAPPAEDSTFERTETSTIGSLANYIGVTAATLRNWEVATILIPERTPNGNRVYKADDVRDAELAHMLRRGGYPLEQIASVVNQVRSAGGTDALSAALEDWKQRLTARGIAMLHAAGEVARFIKAFQQQL